MDSSVLPESRCSMHVVPAEARRGHWIPWNWSYTAVNCKLPRGCWELNPEPLQKKQVLLTTEPSLSPAQLVLPRLGSSASALGWLKYKQVQAGLGWSKIFLSRRISRTRQVVFFAFKFCVWHLTSASTFLDILTYSCLFARERRTK